MSTINPQFPEQVYLVSGKKHPRPLAHRVLFFFTVNADKLVPEFESDNERMSIGHIIESDHIHRFG